MGKQITILLPTDFSVESLRLVKAAAKKFPECRLHIVFMYSSFPPDSITELLFYSPAHLIETMITPSFRKGLSVLRNTYANQLQSVQFTVFHGRTVAAFREFLEANSIEEIFSPATYDFRLQGNAFNPKPYFKKSGRAVHEISWIESKNGNDQDRLADLFLDE